MKNDVNESSFDNELSDLIARLDSFHNLIALGSGDIPSDAPQLANAGRPERCPQSILRLCSATPLRKPITASIQPKPNIRSLHGDTGRQGAAQLLVVRDGTVFELDVVNVEVARQPRWRLDDDVIKTWSEVFRTDSKFRLVSSQQQFHRLRLRLSSMRRKEVQCAINAWLVSSLAAQRISRQTALQIKLLTKIPGDWEQLRVRLRPSRIGATSDRPPNSMRFTRCQEAEIRSTESYREAQKRLQQVWFPKPPSCSDLSQTRS